MATAKKASAAKGKSAGKSAAKAPAKSAGKRATKAGAKRSSPAAGRAATGASGAKSSAASAAFADIRGVLDQLKLPGIDIQAIIAGRRQDIEAVADANKKAFEGMKALVQRQTEMLKEAVAEWRAAVKDITDTDRGDKAAKSAELARRALDKAIANMRELAEMAIKSQSDAWESVGKRFQDNVADLKKVLGRG